MDQQKPLDIHVEFEQFMAAGRSLILAKTADELRLTRILRTATENHELPLWVWRVGVGLETESGQTPATGTAEEVTGYLLRNETPAVIWLKDFHHHFSPTVMRALKDLYYDPNKQHMTLVLGTTTGYMPEDLEREAVLWQVGMPEGSEIAHEVAQWTEETQFKLEVEPGIIGAALKGLTLPEIRHALMRVRALEVPADRVLRVLQEEKRRLIQRTGSLEYIPNVPELDGLGGLENLKSWLQKRRALLLSNNEADREITPKGILLMGVSGCGKSLCIKAISAAWKLPLYRMEMTKIFSSAAGGPEQAFTDACRLMEKMSPAILWIDEIEMGLSAEGSAQSDPAMSRIFAYFLTWMQEKPPGLFVAATANRIDLLPAEMIRKGRFDQVFFVDLPTTKERREIFAIHLKQRGYNPDNFNLDVFADGTEGWNGAEIEQCVISAITSARMESRDLELKDLYASRKQIVPISTTMEEQVRHIRNWAFERAVRASAEA